MAFVRETTSSRYGASAAVFTPPWPVEVDLHLHTTASDGVLTPRQLIEKVAATRLKIISVTDHDSTEGLDEALATAARFPHLTLIPGIEFGAEDEETEVHILGYFIDYRSKTLQEALASFRDGRIGAAKLMVEKLGDLGMPISWDRVRELGKGAVGRPHIARALLEAGYVHSVPEAFDKYIGSDGPARVPRPKLPPLDALDLIHQARGIAVVAHPRTVKNAELVVSRLAAGGLAGLEVYAEKYGMEERERYQAMARIYGLVECGGSDYHAFGNEGEVMPGVSGPPPNTPFLLLERARAMHGDRVGSVPAALEAAGRTR
jgi:hypothetical protein